MQVKALDHVNIITDDLDGTAAFYERLLGLKRGETPGAGMGFKGAWMFDASGDAIIHLLWKNPAMEFGAEHQPGLPTAAVHHVAFRCAGYDGAIERLKAMGMDYHANDATPGQRQIFVKDPNNINLELNFPGG